MRSALFGAAGSASNKSAVAASLCRRTPNCRRPSVASVFILFGPWAIAALVPPTSIRAAGVEDIRFRTTFDDTVDADLARGIAEPKTVDGPVAYEEGRFGQALVVGENGASVAYRIEDNLDVKQGAISFWFMPVDWEPAEHRSHLFLRFPFNSLFRLFTDEAGRLRFEAGTDLADRRGVAASLADLEKGSWAHIVATWSVEELQLYINGVLAGREPCADQFLPVVVNSNFQIGDIPRAKGREAPRKTLIDDFTVYRRPIGPAEFDRFQADERGKARDYAPPVVSIRKGVLPFTIDGEIDVNERNQTTVFGNFLNVTDHKLAAMQTTVRAGYNDNLLYVAVESPILSGVALKADSTNRDDQVWNDDAVQIHLAPAQGGNRFLFIGNSEGTIFDRKNIVGTMHDTTWNGNWQLSNRTANGSWIMEVAIPFHELETGVPADGETWRLNVTRDRVEPQGLSCWAKVDAYADFDDHGYVRFDSQGSAIGASGFAPMTGNRIAIDVEACPSADGTSTQVLAALSASRAGTLLVDKTIPLDLDGTAQVFPLRADIGGVHPDMLRLALTDPRTGLELFQSTVSPGEGKTSLEVTCTPIPSKGICNVSIREQDASVLELDPTAVVELKLDGAAEPVRTVWFDGLTDGSAGGHFDIETLPPGGYEMHARVMKGDRVLDRATVEFVKPAEPWRDLHAGQSDTPPPPWTPMRVARTPDDSLEVDCWGRRHRFDGMPFPSSIRNGQAVQLAAPMALDVRIEGNPLHWEDARIANLQQSDTKVSFESSMRGGPLVLTATTLVEYDGMVWSEVTITPERATEVEALDLVAPIDARYATLMHVPGDVYQTGKTGPGEGWTWDGDARRFSLWFGNEDLGLAWFYERPDQKRFADPDKFVRLERKGDVMVFSVRYVDGPTTLHEPITLAFGLQATPVRSRPPGWRSWGAPRDIGNGIQIPWTTEHVDRYAAGYPEATSPAFFSRSVRHQKRYGRIVPYKSLLWHGIHTPEWKYNHADWDLGGGVNKYSDTREFWWGGRVCGAAETFTDFIAWKLVKHIREHDLDGAYHDLQWSYQCGNANHGCAPARRAIRGDRELNKRLYTAMKQADRSLLKIDHISDRIGSSLGGFTDMNVSGEEMMAGSEEPAKPHWRVWDDYFRNLRIDVFKANGAMGRQWGIVPLFLLQMRNPKPDATEGIFSILLAHDAIPTWEAYARDVRFENRLWRTLETFGIGEADVVFRPYWHDSTGAGVVALTPEGGGPIRPVQVETYDPKPYQRLTVDESYGASIYHRPGRRSLVVLFNYTLDDAVATVQLDAPALGLDPGRARATDAFTRFEWVRADEPIAVRVRSRNFRLIWVEANETETVDRFPGEADEVCVAGDRPDKPQDSCTGTALVGDLWDNPWALDPSPDRPADPAGTELAQIFTLAKPTAIHRVEMNMKYSGVRGPDLRETIRMRLVRTDKTGMPTGEVVAPEAAWTLPWVITDWYYSHYNLRRALYLEPGQYALVMTKPAEDPQEHLHALLPSFGNEAAGEDGIATRVLPGGRWIRKNETLAFGVYGFVP